MKNTLIKVLSFMMALTMIVGCFTAVATAADCTHENATETVVAPTCAERGYTRHVCDDCGYVWVDSYTAKATEHTELETVPATDATCTDPAYEASIVCKTCGTVVSAGEAIEGTEPILHTFSQKVVEGTCEQKGYTTWICNNCGLTAEQCAAKDADADYINPKQKDNNGDGDVDYDDFATVVNNEADPHHVWSYEIVKAIEACKEGLVQRTCALCGTVEDIVIEASHASVTTFDYTALVAAGKYCGKYMTGARCAVCGTYLSTEDAELVESPLAGAEAHNWVEITSLTATLTYKADGIEGTIDPVTSKEFMAITGAMIDASELKKAPTCDEEGYKVVFCNVCGKIEKQVVETLAHDFLGSDKVLNLVDAYEAEFDADVICTPALNTYKYCQNCDYVELWAVKEEAVEHEIEVSEEASYGATCTAAGLTVTYCTICYEWDEENEALVETDDVYYYDHDDSDATDDKSNAYKVEVKSAATGHAMSDWSAYTTDCTEKASAALVGAANVAGGTIAENQTVGIHRVRACENEDCEFAQVQIKVYSETGKHNWPTDDEKQGTDGMVLVAATCTTGSHYEWGCKADGCAATDGINIGGTADDGAKDTSAHVVTIKKGLTTVANNAARGTEFVIYKNNAAQTEEDMGVISEVPVVVSKTVTEATCKKAGVYEIQCECGAIITKTGLMVEHKWDTVYNKNGNSSRNDTGDVSYEYVAATCTKDGQTAGVVCYDCGYVKVATTVLPKGNEIKTSLIPTSQANGELVYTVAQTCKGHTGTALTHDSYKTNGDCQTKSTTWVIYNCCGEKVVTEGDFGSHNYTTATGASSVVAAKLPTCYKAGNHAYATCKVCGLVTINWEDDEFCGDVDPVTGLYDCGMTSEQHILAEANNDYAIPTLEHDFTVPVVKKAETCFTNGYTAHYACANDNCDATYGKEVIKAHGNEYWVELGEALNIDGTPVQAGQHKLATCTEDSIPAGKYCSECMKDWTAQNYLLGEKSATNPNGWTDYAKLVEEATGVHDTDNLVIVKIVNYLTEADLVEDGDETVAILDGDGNPQIVDCTKDAYVIVQCGDCDEAFLVEDTHYTARATHNISNTPVAYTSTALCTEPSYTYKYCINCMHKQDVTVTAAVVPHSYINNQGDEIVIDLSCTKVAEFDGKTCQICRDTVNASALYGADEEDELEPVHNEAKGGQEATCTEAGFVIISCADCGETLVNKELEALNPNHLIGTYCYNDKNVLVACSEDHEHDKVYAYNTWVKYVTEVGQVDATYTTPGYLEYVCAVCNETVKFYNQAVLTAPKLTIDVAEGTVAAAGDKVAVNVYISGYEFKFNTLKFDIETTAGLVLAAENVVIDYAFAAEDNVTATAKQNDGYVSVSIIVPVDVATGEPKDVEITADGAAFVTVYFDVLPTAASAYIVDAEVTDALNIELSKELAKLTNNADKEALKAEFVNSIDVALDKYIADFATAIAGDWDNNGVLDASDSVAIMTASYNADTNTVLDINKNGVVDLEDHVKFLNFYLSDQTALDYLELLGVDYNDYVAAYKNEIDLDKNGKVNDDDKAVIALNLEKEFANVPYWVLGMTTIEDVIDYIVADFTDNGVIDGSIYAD